MQVQGNIRAQAHRLASVVAVLAATFTTALAWAPTATAQAAGSITSTPMTRAIDTTGRMAASQVM
jgi:hypothetical protein